MYTRYTIITSLETAIMTAINGFTSEQLEEYINKAKAELAKRPTNAPTLETPIKDQVVVTRVVSTTPAPINDQVVSTTPTAILVTTVVPVMTTTSASVATTPAAPVATTPAAPVATTPVPVVATNLPTKEYLKVLDEIRAFEANQTLGNKNSLYHALKSFDSVYYQNEIANIKINDKNEKILDPEWIVTKELNNLWNLVLTENYSLNTCSLIIKTLPYTYMDRNITIINALENKKYDLAYILFNALIVKATYVFTIKPDLMLIFNKIKDLDIQINKDIYYEKNRWFNSSSLNKLYKDRYQITILLGSINKEILKNAEDDFWKLIR